MGTTTLVIIMILTINNIITSIRITIFTRTLATIRSLPITTCTTVITMALVIYTIAPLGIAISAAILCTAQLTRLECS
jgi:predicted permease|tara:strand:- start:613 stop:846 length:234 start_codon:yes stop_codon:yes gene_type:complete